MAASPSTARAKPGVHVDGKKIMENMKGLWQLAKKDLTENSKELKSDFVGLIEAARAKRVRTGPKEAKVPSQFLVSQAVNGDVGAELLSKYKEEWSLIHRRTVEASGLAGNMDSELVELQGSVSRSHAIISQCCTEFRQLPDVVAAIERTREKVEGLGQLLAKVEESITAYDRVCLQLDAERRKDSLRIQFEKQNVHVERELQQLRDTLAEEKRQKEGTERKMEEQKLQERQQAFQEMFQQQMADYKEKGSIERAIGAEEREKSSAQLEDVLVEDTDGTASLHEFLSDVDNVEDESHDLSDGSCDDNSESHDQHKSPELDLGKTVQDSPS